MFKQYSFKRFLKDYDFGLCILLIAITCLGILAIGSAKESVQKTQIMGAIVGVIIMLVISLIDYHFVLKFYILIYLFNVALLALVLSSMGDSAGGAQRWITIMGIRFQPSELAKILLILFFAQFIMVNKNKVNSLKVILLSIMLIGVPLFLVKEQPDLSTTIIIAILYCVIMYISGISHKLIIAILALGIPLAVILLTVVVQPDQDMIKDYQQKRILAWLYPDQYADTEAYQQQNSMMAIGAGQLYGKGLNNNEISSVKKGNFISEPQTDFIFAVIGEEWGFIGSSAVIILLMLIALKCAIIGWKARDIAGHIIGAGMGALICFQSFINIGVTTGICPNTGLPLPFVSYGLTSLLSCYIGMGFVLSVNLQSNKNSENNRG